MLKIFGTTVLFILLAAQANASEVTDAVKTVQDSAQHSVPAKPIVRSAPLYPSSELRRGREAWVHVTYCIDESGTVKNASILDSVGNDKFDEAALETVNSWKFEPALVDGSPSWQSKNNTLISFALAGENRGATRRFISHYKKIGKLIDEDKLEEADALFSKAFDKFDLSLYELSVLWAQRVQHEVKAGDMYRLNMALHRATASDGEWIEKKRYMALLASRTRVELALGKYNEAQHSFEDLLKTAGEDNELVVGLQPAMNEVEAMIQGDSAIEIAAEVRAKADCAACNDSWNFSPVRNDFSIQNISGELRSLDMRCDHKRFTADVSDSVDWHIPDSWGSCQIQVYGDPGTTFEVVMFADNPS